MNWEISNRSDPMGLQLADRHYNRQSPGSKNLAPPGKTLILIQDHALWVSLQQKNEFIKHCWKNAWICSTFRNESNLLSSNLIKSAVSNTIACWGNPPENGFITFVNPSKVKSRNPGYCFIKAGWKKIGYTKINSLLVFQLSRLDFPSPIDPVGRQYDLFQALS